MPTLTEDLENQENYPADMRSAERRSSDDEQPGSDQDDHYVRHLTANPYPPTQPFINDDFRRSPLAPCKTTPTNNRQAVMSALRSLQDKIRLLELERSDAEDNIRVLRDDTDKYKDILQHSRDSPRVPKYAPYNVSTSSEANVNAKLETAEHRCNVLEKQLDDMRNLARAAEDGRASVLRKTKLLQEDQDGKEQNQLRQYKNDISELRREYLKLTASQTLTKDKITDIEQQLNEEKVLRKSMRDRTAELETAAETNKILQELALGSKPKKAKKKKKKVSMHKSADKRRPGMEPTEHYKLNLKAIPFTAGKSTSPSHSLTANFQEVLSLMKAHNPKLCQSPLTSRHSPKHRVSSRSHSVRDPDLTDLLLQLQDEFGHLTFEHQELMHQLQETADPTLQQDLERELDAVVAKMENKGEQIARLRRHQDMMLEKRRRKKQVNGATSTSVPACYNGEVEVTTTVRTKGNATGNLVVRPSSASCAQASLNLLKDLKKIKSTLQKDDLTWDCC